MKELLRQAFIAGYGKLYMNFEDWLKDNKGLIEDAIEKHLQSQDKEAVDSNRLEMLEDSFINHPG